ncbi:MAG: T9SS type A sorting domain-containing protein [Bacteroidota bacterium]
MMKKTHLPIKVLICLILVLIQCHVTTAQALGYNNNRIAISADGNNQPDNHPQANFPRADEDDWAAAPAALAMIAKLGLQNQLVHFSYNNFIGAPAHTSETNHMANAANGGIQRWGFNASRFFDVSANRSRAVSDLAEELGKSTSGNPLYFIHMGPAEFFYQAVKQVVDGGQAARLAHVRVISHSGYNDSHLRRFSHHTMAQAITLSGNRIRYTKIKDQNACGNPNVLWCSQPNFSPFHWVRDHPDPNVAWLYNRMLLNPKNKADISDAGMVYYLLEGDVNGSPSKFKTFIGNGISSGNNGGGNLVAFQNQGSLAYMSITNPDKMSVVGAIGTKEKFTLIENSDGTFSFRGSNGNYVSSENGNKPMTCNRATIGGWERFRLESRGNDVFAIKGNNGQYLRNNMQCNSTVVSNWQTFKIVRNLSVRVSGESPKVELAATEVTLAQNVDCIEEVNGLLVFQAENATLRGGWKRGTDQVASGGEYIYFDAANQYGGVNDIHTISYNFTINRPGSYTVKWFMRQPPGEQGSDLGNDAWVYFADDLGIGSGTQLTEFEKFVGRSDNTFTFNGAVEVHNVGTSWMRAVFPSSGDYTLFLSGRSKGLQLDRIVLYNGMGIDEAEAQAGAIEVTGDCQSAGTNSVSFVNAPSSVSTGSNVTVQVNYASVTQNELVASVSAPDGTWLANDRVTVAAGSGTTTLTIGQGAGWAPDADYTLGISIRPVGSAFADNFDYKSTTFDVTSATELVALQNQGSFEYMSISDPEKMSVTSTVGATERFTLIENSDGTFALQGSNGNYVSSENGNKAMTCNRATIGGWEKFTLEDYGNDVYAIKANNGLYLRNNMLCTSDGVSNWQTFKIVRNLSARVSSQSVETELLEEGLEEVQVVMFPNPYTDGRLTLKLGHEIVNGVVRIMGVDGKLVYQNDIAQPTNTIQLEDLSLRKGIYFIDVVGAEEKITKRLMIK